MPQSSRKQRERERDAEFAENDVPRRERNHPATGVSPPMNSARHFFVERNVDSAEKPDREQTEFAEAFPQPESDVTECTATTSHASGIHTGDRQIMGPPPIE